MPNLKDYINRYISELNQKNNLYERIELDQTKVITTFKKIIKRFRYHNMIKEVYYLIIHIDS